MNHEDFQNISKNLIAFRVHKETGCVIVLLLPSKQAPHTYSYVNLTKGHICPCKFTSIQAAIEDMEEKIKEGKIFSYERI